MLRIALSVFALVLVFQACAYLEQSEFPENREPSAFDRYMSEKIIVPNCKDKKQLFPDLPPHIVERITCGLISDNWRQKVQECVQACLKGNKKATCRGRCENSFDAKLRLRYGVVAIEGAREICDAHPGSCDSPELLETEILSAYNERVFSEAKEIRNAEREAEFQAMLKQNEAAARAFKPPETTSCTSNHIYGTTYTDCTTR